MYRAEVTRTPFGTRSFTTRLGSTARRSSTGSAGSSHEASHDPKLGRGASVVLEEQLDPANRTRERETGPLRARMKGWFLERSQAGECAVVSLGRSARRGAGGSSRLSGRAGCRRARGARIR